MRFFFLWCLAWGLAVGVRGSPSPVVASQNASLPSSSDDDPNAYYEERAQELVRTYAVGVTIPRIMYVRVPKAGSTTLQLILKRICDHEELAPPRQNQENTLTKKAAKKVGCNVEHVNVGPWFFERYPALKKAALIGIIRSPLARATSMFFEDNGFCSGPQSRRHREDYKRGVTTLDMAVLRFSLDCKWQLLGGQYKYLKGSYTNLNTPLKVLRHYDAVVVSERLEESLVGLLHFGDPKIALPLEKLVTFGQANHHQSHALVTDLGTKAVGTFLELNRFDAALHALAEKHLDQAKAKVGPAAFNEAMETLRAYGNYAGDCLEEYTDRGGQAIKFSWPKQLEGCFAARLLKAA